MKITAFLKSGFYVVGHYDGDDEVGDMMTFCHLIDDKFGIDSIDNEDIVVDLGHQLATADSQQIVSQYKRLKSLFLNGEDA